MEKAGDMMLVDLDVRRVALELASVEAVVDARRLYFIPGASPPLAGVIAHRNEPVAVVDLRSVFGMEGDSRAPSTVVIARDGTKALGLRAGDGKTSFLWRAGRSDVTFSPGRERYTRGVVRFKGGEAWVLDLGALYEELSRLLSRRR